MTRTTPRPARPISRPLRALAAAAGMALLLAGCAFPGRLAPGESRAQVLERLGAPAARYPLSGGGERLEYPVGGLQQQTWMVDLDADGRVLRVRQVRTLENFFALRVGLDREDTVRREFGAPWEIQHYPLSGLTAWLYPYIEAGVWNSMIAVHFDQRGVVHSVQNGPDPRFLGGSERD